MSKTTAAIEETVKAILAWKENDGQMSAARIRREIDRSFDRIMKLIAPRIRHFIKQYGLAGHWEDAEQVCAIAVHRAIESYDPQKAQFTTFINWMIRGELQGLRFRLMTDQRPSARKVTATTVSLNDLSRATQDEDASPEFLIEDEEALGRTEAGAADYLASSAIHSLLDSYVTHLRQVGVAQLSRRTPSNRKQAAPSDNGLPRLKVNALDPDEVRQLDERIHRNHALVAQRLFELDTGLPAAPDEEDGITKERMRQITKRAAKTMAVLTASDPRFAIMAEAAAPLVRPGGRTVTDGPNPPRKPASRPKAPSRPVGQHVPSLWLGEASAPNLH